jgi:hypothetical protein
MKKFAFVFGIILVLGACSKSNEKEILGTWVNLDDYEGLREFTFSKDTLTIKIYQFYGAEFDKEIIRKYEIVDGIIIMENAANRDEYLYDPPYYNFSIARNKLILSGIYYHEILTKKIEKNLQKEKRKLIGNWVLLLGNTKYEFEFADAAVNIIQYDEYGNLVEKYISDYYFNEHFLKIENIENIIKNIRICSDNLVYYIGKNKVMLFACVARGDSIESKSLFLNKK